MTETKAQREARLAKEQADATAIFDKLAVNGVGKKKNSVFGAIDLSASTYDISGLGLPSSVTGGRNVLTTSEFATALHKTALTRPDIWAGIQYAMYRSNFYSSAPDIGLWGSADLSGIKMYMEAMTVLNDIPINLPANAFLTQQENAAKTLGGNGVRNQIAKVTVPNTLDLNYISDKAFRAALGRPPTAKESKAFASSYQGDVMAMARSNAAATSAAKTTTPTPSAPAPSASVSTHPQTITPPEPTPQASIADNYAAAKNTPPTVSIVGQQDMADPTVAATAFARKSDPKSAAAQNVSNALNSMFQALARHNQ